MDAELDYRLILFALLAGFVAHRAYYTQKRGRSDGDTMKSRDRSPAQVVAGGLNAIALLSSAVYLIYPAALAWAALPFPAWLRWAGALVAVGGFALLQWAHRALSRNWSDAPRLLNDQTLTRTGPYRWVRHPMYTAFLIILSGPLFITANWLVGLSWIAATALEVASRVRFEEALLAETFSNEYHDYAQHTGRLLPRFQVR